VNLAASAGRAWPLPALVSWAAAWGVFALLRGAGAPLPAAMAAAALLGSALGMLGSTPWRRAFVVSGFPLSLAASGLASALPAWGWLVPLALLAAVYPLHAWRDAPMFPTPAHALEGLAVHAPLPPGASVLDAGCGLGDALRELRREYPQATLAGLEWSWPLRALCALRCRVARLRATVRRGDIWAADWSAHDLVYVFQRPESMQRAFEKAQRELRPGAWLVSLEFEAAGLTPTQVIDAAGARRVWLYRMAASVPSASSASPTPTPTQTPTSPGPRR
jgi:Methyltransferase domain